MIYPFSGGDSFSTFQAHRDRVCQEIRSLDNEYVLKASKTELEDHYLAKGRIDPLVLHTDQYHIENRESAQVDVSHDFTRANFLGRRLTVPGTRLTIAIP